MEVQLINQTAFVLTEVSLEWKRSSASKLLAEVLIKWIRPRLCFMWSSHWSGLGGKSSRVIWWLKIPALIQLFRHQMFAAKTRHCVNVPWGTFIGLLGCQHTMTLEMTRRCSDSRNWEIPLIPKSRVLLKCSEWERFQLVFVHVVRCVFWKCPWPFWAQETNVPLPCLCKYNSIHSENSKKKTTTTTKMPCLTSAKVHFPCVWIHPRVLSLQWNFLYFLMLFFYLNLYILIFSLQIWTSHGLPVENWEKTKQKLSDSLCAWQRMTACRCT